MVIEYGSHGFNCQIFGRDGKLPSPTSPSAQPIVDARFDRRPKMQVFFAKHAKVFFMLVEVNLKHLNINL
jgi:hypothetical protein